MSIIKDIRLQDRTQNYLKVSMASKLKHFLRPVGMIVLTFFMWADVHGMFGQPAMAQAFSVSEEREVGEKLLSIVRKEFKLLDDPDVTQYINQLGGQILQVVGPQYFDYHFFVIDNKEFNAFAAPSGLIFIHSGLLEVMDTENELVGVLAHEIGHATSRHIADRMAKSSKVSIGTAALILAGIALGGGALSQALVTGGMAAGASMNLKFSREDEEEADRLAFRYMKEQERDPQSMVDMLRKMRNISRYRPVIPPYLLTHPEPERRMNYVQDLLLMEKNHSYPSEDNFDFLRIKYRVLSMAKEPISVLPLLKREVKDDQEGKESRQMAHYGLSQLYRVMANFDQAEAELKKVMTAYPERTVLTTDLGVLYFESGRFKDALALFQKAAAAAPDFSYHSYNSYYLARTLQQLGKLEQADRIYEDLLEELPRYSRLYYQLSRLRAAQGNTDEGYYYLGVYHWQEGEADTARRYLKQAVSRLPSEGKIRKQAEELLKKIDRLEKI